MTEEIRNEHIEWLVMHTGWTREAFESKTDRELVELYERYVKMG